MPKPYPFQQECVKCAGPYESLKMEHVLLPEPQDDLPQEFLSVRCTNCGASFYMTPASETKEEEKLVPLIRAFGKPSAGSKMHVLRLTDKTAPRSTKVKQGFVAMVFVFAPNEKLAREMAVKETGQEIWNHKQLTHSTLVDDSNCYVVPTG